MKKYRHWLVGLVFVLAAVLLCAHLIPLLIFPGYFVHRPDSLYGHEQQRTVMTAPDGTKLRGWFFNRGAGAPLVVIYTGNNMNAGTLLPIARTDTTRSYLLLNYRGYGDSEGTPSESRLVCDALHCISLARAELGNTNAPLHIIGYSIGSGVATQVAAAAHPTGLTLICPFDCITDVACDFVPVLPKLLLPDTFNSARFAAQIACPVTILRAAHDTLVTAPHTAGLMQAFPTPPVEHVLDADHNSIFGHPDFALLLRDSLTR